MGKKRVKKNDVLAWKAETTNGINGWMNEWTEKQQQEKDKFVQFHHCHNIALVRWGREGRNGERERWTKSCCKRTGSGKSEVCVFSAYCSLPSSFLPKSLFSSIFYRFAKKEKRVTTTAAAAGKQPTASGRSIVCWRWNTCQLGILQLERLETVSCSLE